MLRRLVVRVVAVPAMYALVASAGAMDGMDWTVHPDPVIGQDVTGWKSHGGSFLQDGVVFKAWHNNGGTAQNNVIYTWSSDPVSWPYWGSGDVGIVYSPPNNDNYIDVVEKNGMFYMWVGTSGGCHVATSANGSDWTTVGSISDWHYRAVLATEDGFEAWFALLSDNSSYRHATSVDGVAWEEDGCILPAGSIGTFDEVLVDLDVQRIGGGYYMWYAAQAGLSSPPFICCATSSDGCSWQKHGVEPGFQDFADGVLHPSVVLDGTTLRMWFTPPPTAQIYYAEAEFDSPIPTVSEWGVVVMTLLTLVAGTLVFARRRAVTAR